MILTMHSIACLLRTCHGRHARPRAKTGRRSHRGPAATLEFDGQTLELAWEGGEPGSTIREFIPAGETLEKWTHLASIREYAAIDDPRALAADTLKLTRDTYPDTPSNIIENPTTGDTIIDFAAWPDDNSFLEFNVFKYSKRPGGGVVAQQYARPRLRRRHRVRQKSAHRPRAPRRRNGAHRAAVAVAAGSPPRHLSCEALRVAGVEFAAADDPPEPTYREHTPFDPGHPDSCKLATPDSAIICSP